MAAVFFIFPEKIMHFFTDDSTVISMGKLFFIVIALTEPIMAFAFALGGALRGAGDSVSPFVYGSISDLAVKIIVGYILAIQLNMGFLGIVIGIAVSAFTRAIPTMVKFHSGKWKKIAV